MKTRMTIFASLLLASFAFTGCDDDNDDNYTPDEKIVNVLQEKYPNAQRVEWELKYDHYVADFYLDNIEKEAWINAKGEWVMTESDILFNDLPQAIQTSFNESEYKDWRIDDVDMLERVELETVYVIEVEKGKQEFDLYYAEDGTLVKKWEIPTRKEENGKYILGDIAVVGMAKNGREAIELVRSEKPDVVLMDIRMPEVDGVECTRLIKSAYPNIKVIVLTTFDDDEYVFNALRFGASGYLLKGVSVADLTNAVREVVRGGSIIAPDVASKALEMFARMAKGNLTIGVDEKQTEELQDNEWRIIREVGAGLSNKEIAAALCLSEGTVRNYLSSILSKLELRDRTQLAIWAVQTGVAGRPFGGPQ